MKKHLAVNHSDARGTIRDIFVSSPKDHCAIITFTENAVRANHFHKESTQYTYVIDGEILMATRLVDKAASLPVRWRRRCWVRAIWSLIRRTMLMPFVH